MTSELAARGSARVEWIRSRMPLLARTRADFAETLPFAEQRIGMSLHLEPKTAVLLETLAAGGAELVATGNHGSTQDDVVAYLKTLGMTVFGARDDDLTQHLGNVASVIDAQPTMLLDNGADLAAIIANSQETATAATATEVIAEVEAALQLAPDQAKLHVLGATLATSSARHNRHNSRHRRPSHYWRNRGDHLRGLALARRVSWPHPVSDDRHQRFAAQGDR